MTIAGGGGGGQQQVGQTGSAGYTLVNGTGTILSWTAPNDGQLHSFSLSAVLGVTALETGGAIQVNWTNAAGAQSYTLFAAGQAAGVYYPNSSFTQPVIVTPGSTVTITQASALTAGAAKLFAQLFAQ